MNAASRTWEASITISTAREAEATWLASALGPEAAREVPRAAASIERAGPNRVTVSIAASDAGAMRAALNTYLGWVELSLATARTATTAASPRPSGSK
jgi:tRNA threonylcarbamoyladenosine modification (KEOPS) complex  Pcc1 subunit